MKSRFSTLDVICGVTEIQRLLGLRVYQIYDVDHKTYLFRLHEKDRKETLLLESGLRFHTTSYEWPKNVYPSGFCMKLRKHLKNKRLERIVQLQNDRIVEFQFGSGEATYYVILELYDKGNIILADFERILLHVLRPHHEGENIHFTIGQKYPIRPKKGETDIPLLQLIQEAPSGQTLRNILMQVIESGSALVDHLLCKYKLGSFIIKQKIGETNLKQKKNAKPTDENMLMFAMEDLPKLEAAVEESRTILNSARNTLAKGYVIQKKEERNININGATEYVFYNQEFQPFLFEQFQEEHFVEFDTFLSSVDEYYFQIEHQKIDSKTLLQEREVLKKLSNVRNDHQKRVAELLTVQVSSREKAELISNNQILVDETISVIRSLLAQQMSWPDIQDIVKCAKKNNDTVACTIQQLKLEVNKVTLLLTDPFASEQAADAMPVEVDLSLSAWANACKYFDMKKFAVQKENKTMAASKKALKSAEKKTQQSLKDVRTISTISKARKIYWFEKFFWFISSENYLVIGGRDAQQNELIVKRYLHSSDVYVHAEIQGASSVVIKNPKKEIIPPRTLVEAGTMAISYSVSWNAKIITTAYWVKGDQVSKTAPSGEYLPTGSFMIRGKKNFLPTCQLVMGLGILFKLEDSHIEKHAGERKNKRDDISDTATLLAEKEMKEATTNEIGVDFCEEDEYQNKIHSETDVITPTIANEAGLITNNFDILSTNENSNDTIHTNIKFPDTQVKLNSKNIKVDGISLNILEENQNACKNKLASKSKNGNIKSFANTKENDNKNHNNNLNSVKHRGQNKKLKKLKSKYKDQDEEERNLRMQLLKSAGEKKNIEEQEDQEIKQIQQNPVIQHRVKTANEQNIDHEDEFTMDADFGILDALTGRPFDDDELLFAVPVVAPYQSLLDFKYKLKIIPGVGKRGRAAKSALSIFMNEKTCIPKERDLLKQVKEESLARNIPGKVKVTITQAQYLKK